MKSKEKANKLTAIAVKQELLLWEISQSFLTVEKKIIEQTKKTKRG